MVNQVWHRGIGINVSDDMSLSEQLSAAGLNWQVETSDIRYGQGYQSEYKRAIYRSDNGMLLDCCGSNWMPYQNSEILETFHKFCEGTELKIDHLGFLEDGRIIFASADLPKTLDVKGVGDIVKSRILLFNYHKVGYGLQAKIQLERLVCTNGMTQNVHLNGRTMSHIGAFSENRVLSLLERCYRQIEDFGKDAEVLANNPMTEPQAMLILISQFGDARLPVNDQPAIVRTCFDLFCGKALGSDMLSAYATAWGLLNCVTEYFNHRARVRGGDASHLNSLWLGSKAAKQRSFQQVLMQGVRG